MNDIKIRLSLVIPGATMLSSQECEQNPKENYDEHKVIIQFSKGKGKKAKELKKFVTIKTRKCNTAKQSINITEEAYNHMISTPTSAKLARIWNMMPKKKRLEAHFDLIANDLHALSYSFEILNG